MDMWETASNNKNRCSLKAWDWKSKTLLWKFLRKSAIFHNLSSFVRTAPSVTSLLASLLSSQHLQHSSSTPFLENQDFWNMGNVLWKAFFLFANFSKQKGLLITLETSTSCCKNMKAFSNRCQDLCKGELVAKIAKDCRALISSLNIQHRARIKTKIKQFSSIRV